MKFLCSSAFIGSLLLAGSLLVAQEDVEDQEDKDLLNKAIDLLETAKLDDVLQERRLLQELDLEAIPDAEGAIEQAKAKLKELQESGVIPPEVINKVAGEGAKLGLGGTEDETPAAANDLIGAAPKKAVKALPDDGSDIITIENSKQFTGDLKEGIMVFEGDVLVTNGGPDVEMPLTLRCDKLTAYLEDEKGEEANEVQKKGSVGGLRSAVATGRMVVINTKVLNEKTGEWEPVEARCQEAVFDGDKLYLYKWPELNMPGRMMKAKDSSAYVEATMGKDGMFKPQGAFKISLKKPETEE